MELRNLLANYEEHVSTLSSSDFGTETWDLIASSAYEAALSVYDNIKQNWGWQHEGTVPGELCVRVLKRHTRAFVSDGIASAPIRELTDRLAETEDSITTDIPTVRRMVRAFAQLAVLYLDADDPRLANAGGLIASVSWRPRELDLVENLIEILAKREKQATTPLGRKMLAFRRENTLGGVSQMKGDFHSALHHHSEALRHAYDDRARLTAYLNISEDAIVIGAMDQANEAFAAAHALDPEVLEQRMNAVDYARDINNCTGDLSGLNATSRDLLGSCLRRGFPDAEDAEQRLSIQQALNNLSHL